MSSTSIARVHYFERQYLRRDDFVDEQHYHADALRRHLVGQHVWGVAGGLELVASDEGLFVEPGLAVDGYGRQLVLTQRRILSTRAFIDKDSDRLDVWLVYQRRADDAPGPGWAPCADGDLHTRWTEDPIVRCTVRDPAFPDPRRPKGVPEGDFDLAASQLSPDENPRGWPVYLGQIHADRSDPQAPVYSVSLEGRPYVGVVGAALYAPWSRGEPSVVLGSDASLADPAFAVHVPGQAAPALEIDTGGKLTAHGEMNVHGDLEIRGGALEIPVPVPSAGAASFAGETPSEPPATTVPVTAQPWRIYRHRTEGDVDNEIDPAEELRVEMAPDSGRVVIGTFSEEDKAFKPCLTINADCTVTVHGDLVVEGQIEGGPLVSAGLSSVAETALLGHFQSGTANAGFFLSQAAFNLAQNPVFVNEFARQLRMSSPGTAETLGEQLRDRSTPDRSTPDGSAPGRHAPEGPEGDG